MLLKKVAYCLCKSCRPYQPMHIVPAEMGRYFPQLKESICIMIQSVYTPKEIQFVHNYLLNYSLSTLSRPLTSPKKTAPPGWLSGERVGLMTWWL